MNRFALAAALLTLAGVAHAGSMSSSASGASPMSLDMDKDGSLSKEELKGNDLLANFDQLDGDKNGMLSQAEIDGAKTSKANATVKGKDLSQVH